jgi:hypothetical protein
MKMFYSCDIYMRTIVWRNICHADISRIFDLFTYVMKSRDSSVGIALCYGLDDRSSRVRFPAGAGNFSLHHRVQNGSGAHPASYPVVALTLGIKRPGGEADHSPPSNAEVTHPYVFMAWCLVKHRDNFTFSFYKIH